VFGELSGWRSHKRHRGRVNLPWLRHTDDFAKTSSGMDRLFRKIGGATRSDDAEAGRRHANELSGQPGRPTALEIWKSRSPIHAAERENFLLTLDTFRSPMKEAMNPESQDPLTQAELAAIERRVVRQALVELGILSTNWRSLTLPMKPRKCARIS